MRINCVNIIFANCHKMKKRNLYITLYFTNQNYYCRNLKKETQLCTYIQTNKNKI